MPRPVRIANCSGFYGDRFDAAREMLAGPIDVLTGDYLAELTMLILWKARRKDPALGYATTFLRQMQDVLGSCLERGIKVVANAGGLNPKSLAARITELAPAARVAYLTGDDLAPTIKDLQAEGHDLTNLDTGLPLANAELPVVTAHAYLGGWGITAALQAGADVVICPRVTDASLVTGPAAWWHGWGRDDWDALAGAVAAGHVIECGPQATGGNYPFLDGDHRPPLSRLPGGRGRRRREQRDHQASRHRRAGLARDRHRSAAVRNRPARLPQPRRHRPLRHHHPGPGRAGPGDAGRHPRQPAPGHPQGRRQHAGRLPQHHDHGHHRPGRRGQGRARHPPAARPAGRRRPVPGRRHPAAALRPARRAVQRAGHRPPAGHGQGPGRTPGRPGLLRHDHRTGPGRLRRIPHHHPARRRQRLRGLLARPDPGRRGHTAAAPPGRPAPGHPAHTQPARPPARTRRHNTRPRPHNTRPRQARWSPCRSAGCAAPGPATRAAAPTWACGPAPRTATPGCAST